MSQESASPCGRGASKKRLKNNIADAIAFVPNYGTEGKALLKQHLLSCSAVDLKQALVEHPTVLHDLAITPKEAVQMLSTLRSVSQPPKHTTKALANFSLCPVVASALYDLSKYAEERAVAVDSTLPDWKRVIEIPVRDRVSLNWKRKTLRIRVTTAWSNRYQIDLSGVYVGHLVSTDEERALGWTSALFLRQYVDINVPKAGIVIMEYALFSSYYAFDDNFTYRTNK